MDLTLICNLLLYHIPARCAQTTASLACALGLFLITHVPAFAESLSDPTISSRVSQEIVQIAEPFEFSVIVNAGETSIVSFPIPGETLGDFNVLSFRDQPGIPMDEGRKWTRTYVLDCYASGEVTVPSVPITVDSTILNSDAVTISIQSAAGPQATTDSFRDIKGAVEINVVQPQSYKIWWFIAGAVLIAAITCLISMTAYKRRKRGLARKLALKQLRTLQTGEAYLRGNIQMILPALTDILRRFVEDQLRIPATHQTTSEFLQNMQADHRFPQSHQSNIRKILSLADQVKFAKSNGGNEVVHELFDQVRKFVDETSKAEPINESSAMRSPSTLAETSIAKLGDR